MSERKEQNEELEVKSEVLEEKHQPEETDEMPESEKEAVETEGSAASEEKDEAAEPETEEQTGTEEAAEAEEEVEASEEDEASESSKEAEKSEEDLETQIANLNKQDAAVLLIKKAKHIVHDAEAQMDACKMLLSDDLQDFEAAKQALKFGGMDESEALLEELGFREPDEDEDKEVVVFETKEEVQPVHISDVSSGKFTGFLLALLGGAVTAAGMIYVATEKVGVTLDVTKVPSREIIDKVLGWYGSFIGRENDALVGGPIVLVVVLFVMWLIYTIRISLKAGSNLQFAKEELQKAEEYASLKGTCKDEMDKIDAYIKDAVQTMKDYEVVLHEQEGKLKRIRHFEKADNGESAQYHEKSLQEMTNTHDLIQAIKDFLNVPMSEDGKLSGKSTLFLHSAKSKLQKVLERLHR